LSSNFDNDRATRSAADEDDSTSDIGWAADAF